MSDLTSAIKQICEEKGLSYEAVIETIESALSAAYRKDFGTKNQNIKVEFDPETTKSKVFDVKTVVEDLPEEELAELEKEEEGTEEKTEAKKEVVVAEELAEGEEEEKKFNPKTDLQISDAKLIKKTAKVGEEHEVVNGIVQRREGKIVLVDLGKSIGVLPSEEQIYGENYAPGERIKVYVKEVSLRPKGPEIILSRTSDEILKKVFFLEIPEVSNGLIEIKSVAREAGLRAKVAVYTAEENVDPIGSCVGQRGARIQTIISELGGEKVDIIEYDENPIKFIANALSPAKIININTFVDEKRAEVFVAENQLSLAIGKGGQNARLAAKLTGWKIDIIQASDKDVKKDEEEKAAAEEKETQE